VYGNILYNRSCLGYTSLKASGVFRMKLTPRLQAIADKIPPGSAVADIGSDHAYIPVYLLVNRLARRVIASDNNKGPLTAAAQTLKLFNLEKAVDLRLADGLEAIKPEDDVDTVVIAGMGGETICSILARGKDIISAAVSLVLQPMTDAGLVRRWLADNGFAIVDEDIAQEGARFYEIIVARRGQGMERQDFSDEIGPVLLAKKHPLLKPMLEQRLRRLRKAAAYASHSAAARERVRQLEERARYLEEVLSWL